MGRLDSDERRLLGTANAGTIVVTGDRAIFRRGLNLMAQPYDRKNWRLVGEPGVIGIVSGRARVTGGPPVADSPAGILVYPNETQSLRYLAWFSRDDGQGARLASPAAPWGGAFLNPDGQRAAVLRLDAEGNLRLWMVDTGRGTAIPLGNDDGIFGPICWSPDGQEIFYGRRRAGRQELFARGSSGGSAERVVYESENLFKSPYGVSPDGHHLLFRQLDPGTLGDIWYVPTGGGEAAPLVVGNAEEWGAAFSPDGRWVVYVSEESGRPELYVTRFPSGEGKLQLTTDGAGPPIWGRNTWEILYSTPRAAS